MDHNHHTAQRDVSRARLAWALAINLTFLIVEIAGGLLTNSLALLADAGHMAGDVAALGLSLFVLHLAGRPSTEKRTFGLMRAEVLGAFINGAGLVVIVAFILREAWQRMGTPQTIDGPLMLGIAVIGLGANLASAFILAKSRHANINVQGAFFHMLADSFASGGAILAGGIIWAIGWQPVDWIVSIVIALLILWSTWGFLGRTINILLEAVPEDIDYTAVKQAVEGLREVDHVQDLHIWTITSGLPILSAHIVLSREGTREGQWEACLAKAKRLLKDQFGISHSTLEVRPFCEGHREVSCAISDPFSRNGHSSNNDRKGVQRP